MIVQKVHRILSPETELRAMELRLFTVVFVVCSVCLTQTASPVDLDPAENDVEKNTALQVEVGS